MDKEIYLSYRQTIKRAWSFILPLCVLSILIASLVISISNDMYAFVKKDMEISVNITEARSLDSVSEYLEGMGVISNRYVFSAYVKSKDRVENVEQFVGQLILNSNMSYREILYEFSK